MLLAEVAPRPTLVVAARTTWQELPETWPSLSQEVWGCLRAGGVTSGCPNVMLYRDGVPHVEVGVVYDGGLPLTGRVQVSELPGGRVATTTHRGSYAGLADSHEAVLTWCRQRGHLPTGVRWEVYGPHDPDPEQIWVELSWLLAGG